MHYIALYCMWYGDLKSHNIKQYYTGLYAVTVDQIKLLILSDLNIKYPPFSPLHSSALVSKGPVETWLLAFEKMMRRTLYSLGKTAFSVYPASTAESILRSEWLWSFPAQVQTCWERVFDVGITWSDSKEIKDIWYLLWEMSKI